MKLLGIPTRHGLIPRPSTGLAKNQPVASDERCGFRPRVRSMRNAERTRRHAIGGPPTIDAWCTTVANPTRQAPGSVSRIHLALPSTSRPAQIRRFRRLGGMGSSQPDSTVHPNRTPARITSIPPSPLPKMTASSSGSSSSCVHRMARSATDTGELVTAGRDRQRPSTPPPASAACSSADFAGSDPASTPSSPLAEARRHARRRRAVRETGRLIGWFEGPVGGRCIAAVDGDHLSSDVVRRGR
jgi:hypothetical protein